MKSEKIAVCMIAKNCEDIVDTFFKWANNNFLEINVVVDTENDDMTLAKCLTWQENCESIKVVEHKFDNFSAQKNRAFAMATTPWVLSVDSDEIYEDGIPWDRLVLGMDRSGHDVAGFDRYNLQKDFDHYKPPPEMVFRLMRKDLAKMDGKLVDESVDLVNKKTIHFPFAHIHFGHVRKENALKLKGGDRIKFKDDDPCDGKGLNIHGEDWFIERNKKWDIHITECTSAIKKTIRKYK